MSLYRARLSIPLPEPASQTRQHHITLTEIPSRVSIEATFNKPPPLLNVLSVVSNTYDLRTSKLIIIIRTNLYIAKPRFLLHMKL